MKIEKWAVIILMIAFIMWVGYISRNPVVETVVKSGSMFHDHMELKVLEEFLTHSDDIALQEIRNFIKENE